MINKNIKITLTDFIDFIMKYGRNKQTKVKQIKTRGGYSQYKDYYKPIREKLIDIHSKNGIKNDIKNILRKVSNNDPMIKFEQILTAYLKFWGRKEIIWFDPYKTKWKINSIEVTINPELGLIINGKHYSVKLYFKEDKLTKMQADIIITLMKNELRNKYNLDVHFAVLDIRNGKFYTDENIVEDLTPLLRGEASNFEIIWSKITI